MMLKFIKFINLFTYVILFCTSAASQTNSELINTVMERVNYELERQLNDFETRIETKILPKIAAITSMMMQFEQKNATLSPLYLEIQQLTNLIDLHHRLFAIKNGSAYSKLLCPVGWDLSPMQQTCVKAIEGHWGKTWNEAEKFCNALGGNLVSIHSNYTNAWMLTKVGPGYEYWIGMNDINQKGVYEWSNGKQQNYLKFGNEGGNEERCYYLRTVDPFPGSSAAGKWYAAKCNRLILWFICEIEPINGNI